MHDIAGEKEDYVKLYIEEFGSPIRAANLCASYEGKKYNGLTMSERVYALALEKLVETKGTVVNRHLSSGKARFNPATARRQNLSER